MPGLNTLTLQRDWRDYWGWFDGAAARNLQPLADACYVPRLYKAPDLAQEIFGPNGYLAYMLNLPVGAFIYAISHTVGTGFQVQITDVALDRALWSEPVPDGLFVPGAQSASLPNPYFLPEPHPVTGVGLFKVEFWAQSSFTNTRCQIVLRVAEPDQC